MSEHTPGPWRLKSSGTGSLDRIYGPDDIAILSVVRPDPEREATAKLIAASPDLLAAVELMRDSARSLLDGAYPDLATRSDIECYTNACKAADLAIAKAEGRAT